jgi:hypothetical protein
MVAGRRKKRYRTLPTRPRNLLMETGRRPEANPVVKPLGLDVAGELFYEIESIWEKP